MIKSELETIKYPNGEIQRYQILSGFAWSDISYVQAEFTKEVYEELIRLYSVFVVPKHRELYGTLIAFYIPKGFTVPFSSQSEEGLLLKAETVASVALEQLVKDKKIRATRSGLVIEDKEAESFINELQRLGALNIIEGERDEITIMAIGHDLGFLSTLSKSNNAITNSQFFLMDIFDKDSPYDIFGTPYGMRVIDGKVLAPPTNEREVLIVRRDGSVKIERPLIQDIEIAIGSRSYSHGINATFYARPKTRTTPKEEGQDIVIVSDEVVALHEGGGIRVPMGGFIIHTRDRISSTELSVTYKGLEDVSFALQTGSSAVIDGRVQAAFNSPFYSIKADPIPFPPTLYPLSHERDRAPRMAIGADRANRPVIIWAEGASKLFYSRGNESAGASLTELALYAESKGVYNAVNMDGGGSAEIFLNGRLTMHVSDRHSDNSDAERPVPMGLYIKG